MRAWISNLPRLAVACLGLGVLFAALGVYDTDQTPFIARVVFWTATMAIGLAASVIIVPLAFERLPEKTPVAVRIVLASALISIPVFGLLLSLDWLNQRTFRIEALAEEYLYVWIISTIVTAIGWFLFTLRQTNSEGEAAGQASAAPAEAGLAHRLPIRLRDAEIWAVEAEDHYLRVHTSAGQELILLRLADAIRELSDVEGQQTHRSWWVARAGLAGVSRANGKVTLKLKSGVEAPVSRTYLPTVRARGWL